jgi:2'-5' RNA ligase
MIEHLTKESRLTPPIEIALGDVQVFPGTNVIYIALVKGERELHALHENLNSGQLEYDGPYPYHPHVTLAQDFPAERVAELVAMARRRWASYDGPREFTVECLSFVQNVAPGTWVDLARIPMASPVGVCA